jgi:hypothetical protein
MGKCGHILFGYLKILDNNIHILFGYFEKMSNNRLTSLGGLKTMVMIIPL